MGKHFHYYVEGHNEKKLVNVLKSDMQMILSGKVDVLNVLTEEIGEARLRTLEDKTTVILIFDTDVDIPFDIIQKNLADLKKSRKVQRIILVPQVHNIEEELVYSTDIHAINELLPTRTNHDFKDHFNRMANENIRRKLEEHRFDIRRLWSRIPGGNYRQYGNDASQIKTARNR